jgi:beta-glucanase (GH16 family)
VGGRRVVLAAALLALVVLPACATTTTLHATAHSKGISCGPAPARPGGGDWRCVFDDEFSGSALDASKWAVVSSRDSGYRNGPECYLGAGSPLGSDDVAVGSGVLRLTARALPAPVDCPSSTGDFASAYSGAFVSTYGRFAATFGRVEIRAAFPRVTVPGVHAALWLYPTTLGYGATDTGEIDIGEYFSRFPDRVIPFLHYTPAVADGSNTNDNCLVADPWTFHTYLLVWQPGRIQVSYDGHLCLDHAIAPAAPLTGSQPFDQSYAINLTQALGVTGNAFDPAATPLPATTSVDYVRVWE